MILDSTCSKGKKWPPNADIRMDIRKEAQPDIVADARYLPFRDGIFEIIFCDPPHILYPGKTTWAKNGIMTTRFGYWKTKRDWIDFIEKTNVEFARTLLPEGALIYKILDGKGGGTTKLKDLDRMTNFVLAKEEVETSRGMSRKSKVHYLGYALKTFMNQMYK